MHEERERGKGACDRGSCAEWIMPNGSPLQVHRANKIGWAWVDCALVGPTQGERKRDGSGRQRARARRAGTPSPSRCGSEPNNMRDAETKRHKQKIEHSQWMGGGRGRNTQVRPQREEGQAISQPATKSTPIYHKINYNGGASTQDR